MSEKWYYVQEGERQGPVDFDAVLGLFKSNTLNNEDYVWTKGFENWLKIKDVDEFHQPTPAPPETEIPTPLDKEINLVDMDLDVNCIFIRIGADRGTAPVEYGPFSVNILKKLYKENRINGKTHAFIQGMNDWTFMGDIKGFEQVFEEMPPVIDDSERRTNSRKPFIARMFIQNNQKIFEGICRDISIGGMQVLVDHFPGVVGDRITINVHPENSEHHFVASGEIVRMLEGSLGFSFRFINLGEDAINAINGYLSQ
jgi:hypothetical protein